MSSTYKMVDVQHLQDGGCPELLPPELLPIRSGCLGLYPRFSTKNVNVRSLASIEAASS
ncbi:MAG: hypothetical protein ACJAVI_005319 [Candidatus Azotimanducaceae bacterium]|jgi:hypothetical protein